MKKLGYLALLSIGVLLLCIALACEGDEGVPGPQGPAGEDGNDATIQNPEDRVFAVCVFNGTLNDHNGANVLTLTFDSTTTPSSNVVVANRITSPPVIDGIDDGTSVWGSNTSNLDIEHQAYGNNYIYDLTMRASYDDYNIYFFLQWDEENEAHYVVKENREHQNWIYSVVLDSLGERTDEFKWTVDEVYEDRVGLMFLATAPSSFTAEWASQGCLTGCHDDDETMSTHSPTRYFDVWQWSSSRSDKLGIGLDRVLVSRGFVEDAGIGLISRNLVISARAVDTGQVFDSLPINMHVSNVGNTDYVAEDPMWDYYMTPFDALQDWEEGDEIPGWIAQYPSEGNDLLKAKGIYSNGTWTVEFSRPRVTDDINDTNF
jgi:Ethylbenzene dehydrogenase